MTIKAGKIACGEMSDETAGDIPEDLVKAVLAARTKAKHSCASHLLAHRALDSSTAQVDTTSYQLLHLICVNSWS